MLQQTQVKTVIPYYERWMRQFPDVKTLAAAPFSRVLKAWEGLGYYMRARNLHAAAKLIVAQHAGKFPARFENVLALPGIGRYTAGAICSIAYDARAPILDGNVIRVLCRCFGIRDNARLPRTQKRLWALAESLLPDKNVGEFNESLMELGALVCQPQNPRCEICPLRRGCVAHKKGVQAALPNLSKRAAAKQILRAAVLVRHHGALLLCRDRSVKLLGALWRLPFVETRPRETRRLTEQRFAELFHVPVRLKRPIATVRHSVTTSRITLTAWETAADFRSLSPRRNGFEWKWCNSSALNRLVVDAATNRILKLSQFRT